MKKKLFYNQNFEDICSYFGKNILSQFRFTVQGSAYHATKESGLF